MSTRASFVAPGAGWEPLDSQASPLGRLWRLLAGERRLVGTIYTYATLAGLFSLTLPLGVQAIIGLVSGGLILQPVVLLIAFVIGGTVATGALQLLQLSVVESVQQRVFARLAFAMAARVGEVRLDRVTGIDLPELMNRFFEIKTVQKSLSKLLTDWVAAGLQILFGLILLSFYHPYFSLFGALLLLTLFLILRLTAPRGWDTSLGESRHKYRVAHWLEELAYATRTLRFAGSRQLATQRMDHEVARYLEYRRSHFRVLVLQSTAFVAFKTLITAGLLILGSVLVVNRQITLGQFVASEIVIVTVLVAVEKVILGIADVYDILTALEKASHAVHLPPESGGAAMPVARGEGVAVRLDGISFAWEDHGTPLLHALSLELRAGERVTVTGPHGSGSSTLIALVGGLLPGYTGALTFDGVSWRDLDAARARARMAWCAPEPELFEGTILENVALGRDDISTERVIETLQIVGLGSWLAQLPDGLATVIRAEGRELPRNVVARLSIARAIAGRPRLLLVDHSLDRLDPRDRAELSALIFDRAAPWTALVTSHARDVLLRGDRLVVLDAGRVQADGPPAELATRNSYLSELWKLG